MNQHPYHPRRPSRLRFILAALCHFASLLCLCLFAGAVCVTVCTGAACLFPGVITPASPLPWPLPAMFLAGVAVSYGLRSASGILADLADWLET